MRKKLVMFIEENIPVFHQTRLESLARLNITNYCNIDGSIDWARVVAFNSATEKPRE